MNQQAETTPEEKIFVPQENVERMISYILGSQPQIVEEAKANPSNYYWDADDPQCVNPGAYGAALFELHKSLKSRSTDLSAQIDFRFIGECSEIAYWYAALIDLALPLCMPQRFLWIPDEWWGSKRDLFRDHEVI